MNVRKHSRYELMKHCGFELRKHSGHMCEEA
jgi:hypothetical protein